MLTSESLYGFRLVATTAPQFCFSETMQYRFPRSKKRRIRRKWQKDRRNWKSVPKLRAYQIGDTIYMHPDVLNRLTQEIARQNDDRIARKIFGNPWRGDSLS